ncbi:DNA internalization-related competence protein ComEC/Rec2 [Chloroflexota bacterium]
MFLVYLSSIWLAGIYTGWHFYLSPLFMLVAIAPLPFLYFFRGHRRTVILTSLCLVTFFGAASHADNSLNQLHETDLRFYNEQGLATVKGTVSRDLEVADQNTRLYLSATEIDFGGGRREIDGTALLFVHRYSEYRYGDVLTVTGTPQTPPQFVDFNYQGYLAHQDIHTILRYPQIEIMERGRGFPPMVALHALRQEMAQTLSRVIPEPEASLAQGIILGIRSNIPASVKADFARSGIAHLLAISGLHLGIVAGIVLSLGIWLFRRRHYHYLWLAMGSVWVYALLTGMYPPVLRAAIMVSLFLIGDALGRQRSALTALMLSAAIMVGISPYLLGNVSFQLSFLAMAGLVFIFPRLRAPARNFTSRILGEKGMLSSAAFFTVDSLCVTLAAVIAVWPAVAYYFGIVSLTAPLATLLALPALPAVITTGLFTGLLGFLALPLAQAAGWLSWLFLLYIYGIARTLGALPAAYVETASVSAPFILSYYALLTAAVWTWGNNRKLADAISRSTVRFKLTRSYDTAAGHLPARFIVPPLLVLAILTSIAASSMPDDRLHISFLDVGEGDATLIQQGNQQILIDGGPSPQVINLQLSGRMPFWDRTIDLVILTHPHADHLAGLLEVLQRYHVQQVLYPDLDYDSPRYRQWLTFVEDREIPHTLARAGQQISLGNSLTITVINPQPDITDRSEADVDNNSVVLHLEKGNVSFLLSGDIFQKAEQQLLSNRAELTSTVLKIPHHGAVSAMSPEFLAATSPQLAVISADPAGRFQHPSPEVVEILEETLGKDSVLRTDVHGTIEFITDGQRLWLKTDGAE